MSFLSSRASCLVLTLVLLFGSLTATSARAQVSLTTLGSAYTQNFDTLPASGSATWTNNSTLLGWYHARMGTGTTIVADSGINPAGNLYSYGSGTATDRALGSVGSGNGAVGDLFWGVHLQNNTGATIVSLDISYSGEQWRNSAAAAQTVTFSYLVGSPSVTGSLAEFQSAGVAVSALDVTSPITGGGVGALDGNSAANRVTQTFSITGLSIPNGSEVMLRWADPDHAGADHGLSIDDFSVTPQGGVGTPTLSISDVALAEGDPPGTTTFTFAVSLTAPAGPGGVTFDIATAENTAQDHNPVSEDNDYVAQSLTGQSIPAGSTGPYNFSVTVNRDTSVEANETFFVNVTNLVGANAGDLQGLGRIINDDVALMPIHDIQGPGASSPLFGASVTTRGIVTGVRSNGFFIQEADPSVDADPATSEGIFIFTNSAPPAAAVVGALVQVTGTVAEYVPSSDPLQPPLTELTSPTVLQLSTGNPLPTPVPLTAFFPDPAGVFDQLERLEGMRVSVASLNVVGPTQGAISESNATATSNGVFYGVVTGVTRPFREAGIQAPDPAPTGTIPPIPRFDSNPERIRVDSDGLVGGLLLDVGTGAVVTGLVGPLDYALRAYTILPDPGALPAVAGGPTATAVTPATGREFTIATFSLQDFFDSVNDPGIGEPVLTATAFDRRLGKASLAIRGFLGLPDIIGVEEVENLTSLQTLAARMSSDALAASQPDPQYVAYLIEGNDSGGIDVGLLVKTALVTGATPRVEVVEVQQELAGTLFVNPDSSTESLNDRPPLRLNAIVHHPNGASFPVTVIVNHLLSPSLANSLLPGANGWATQGMKFRAKRQMQAADLANLVQARQTSDPTEHIVLVGDFNAFEFNDGLGHSMGVIAGTPAPDNETAVPGDGVDLVNPDFTNLGDTPPPAERYGFILDGNAQNLDHILVNQPLIADTSARRLEHPRISADFPETARNDGATPVRLSDHDPAVSYFDVFDFAAADLSLTKSDTPDPVTAGTNLAYGITVTNAGPDPASTTSWSDTLPAGTTFVSLSSPGGWSCTTPAVGASGAVTCDNASFAVGSAIFTLTLAVDPSVAAGAVLSNTATVTSATADPNSGNESDTETTSVAASADLAVTQSDTPDPVTAGTNLVYTLTLTNAGPSDAASVSLSDTLPVGTNFVSLSSPAGWSCTTPAVGATGAVTCDNASFPMGSSSIFTLTLQVGASVAAGAVLSNTATVTSATADPNSGNESGTETTSVAASADLAVTQSDTPDPVTAGTNLVYTLTLTNAGPSNAASVSLSDSLPAGTTFISLSSPAGWSCTTPAVGASGAVSCDNASFPVGSGIFTLTLQVGASVAASTLLSNTATVTSATSDPNTGNESGTATTSVVSPALVTATKAISGDLQPGGLVTYSIVLRNEGAAPQQDNPGNELTDVLPSTLTLVDAVSTSGVATASVATNTLSWNGAIPAGGSVTISIHARVNANVPPATVISNQGALAYDADGNGTNETPALTDDPSLGGTGDSTNFTVVMRPSVEIPTLDGFGLALLVLLLAGTVALVSRRSSGA